MERLCFNYGEILNIIVLFVLLGNQEKGWNDPPQFSYGLRTQAQGVQKLSLMSGTPLPAKPLSPTLPLAPPPSTVVLPACRLSAVDCTALSTSTHTECEASIEDVMGLLYWALTACRTTVKCDSIERSSCRNLPSRPPAALRRVDRDWISRLNSDHAGSSESGGHLGPRSAYLLYYFDFHQSMQQEFPHLPQSEINKRINENWKRLTVADKGYYLERTKIEKQGIDPDSQVAVLSADVPGFRKILLHSNYVVIPKSTVSEKSVAKQVDLCLRQGERDSEATSQTLSHDTLFSPMGLGSEVELPEHCIAIEGLTDETAAALSQSGC
ncbi:HMGX3 protein, partial [Polyodon spathula]|nr:HMGX3 protein [Polyodon spathula]